MSQVIVALSELLQSGRWKPEQFCETANVSQTAAFDLLPIDDFVSERREFLDPQEFGRHRFHYVGLEHVAPYTGDLVDYAPKHGDEVKSRSKVFRTGDVLYGRLRSYLNKVFVAAHPMFEGICSGEFFVLMPDRERCDPVFLRQLLASGFVQRSLRGMPSGSALPRLQLDDLLRLRVPLPPMSIQREVRELLEGAKSRRDSARMTLAQQPELLEAEISSLLMDGQMPRAEALSTPAFQFLEQCSLPPEYSARPRRRPGTESIPIFGQD